VAKVEVHLFLPQMRMTMETLVERAQAAEAAGFDGIAFMDHLAPPLALDQPMFEAMTAATWIAARTERMHVSHLVLCDALRHPTVLARQAVTLDHASGGRFELGIGWGSVPEELETYGVFDTSPRVRVERLAESLEVLRLLWSGEVVSFEGSHFTLRDAQERPTPLGSIPIVIGGTGPRTVDLVARYADWWNLPIHRLGDLDSMRERAGTARVSVQQMVGFVADESRREEVESLARRRFPGMAGGRSGGPGSGSSAGFVDRDQVGAHLEDLAAQGVERLYAWFTDFATPETLQAVGEVLRLR
jgi:alkanesulfonate monooxygenase SsuD/methylene tetrahydromethanopterin reductase-like flavin-dependent oxidoreductase (luciferase family)